MSTLAKLKHILVAVDGSESATKALNTACELAAKNGATLTILNVLTIPRAVYSSEVMVPFDEIQRDMKEQATKVLSESAAFAAKKGVSAKTAIVEKADSPVAGITEYANENAIDLIVIGTRGLGGFKRLLLGSVASGVTHYAHCSVLVVR